MNLPHYILREIQKVTDIINEPLKSAQRVKYTCFDVSKNYIAFGATSGSLYIFNRCPCEFLQVLPNKEGIITRISISPNDKYISFANGRGLVTVVECDRNATKSNSLIISKEHQGNEVSALVWNLSCTILFIGDDVGKVSTLQLPTFITKSMFQNSSQTILNLDSRICQLDTKDHWLLVSTWTRCYICDTTNEQYRQIGQKLREGEFGTCFGYTNNSKGIGSQDSVIFCARPSSRLWEAVVDGDVLKTHQFKQVLTKGKMMTLELYKDDVEFFNSNIKEEKSCNFSRLFLLKNGVIFTFKNECLYFLNTLNIGQSRFFCDFTDITDCRVHSNTIYLWNGSLVVLEYIKIEKFIMLCYKDSKYSFCAQLCDLYRDYLLNETLPQNIHILSNLRNKSIDDITLTNIKPILDRIDNIKINATQTKCGIYVMENAYNLIEKDNYNVNKNNDILYKETSHKVEREESEDDKICKLLYQSYRLSVLQDNTDLNLIIEEKCCDIQQIYALMAKFEDFCTKINLEESKYIPSFVFLKYIDKSTLRDDILNMIIKDDSLCGYFVNACIVVNMVNFKDSCTCGFPLPCAKIEWKPLYVETIDKFIELQWTMNKDQCYEICKKMPYMWKKYLYLRGNDDLLSVLHLLLQMVDENLLYSYLPNFTIDIWEQAIELYSKLYSNVCLNCNRESTDSFKGHLHWDSLGKLMIKTLGGKKAIEVMNKKCYLIKTGDLSLKFYHTCLLVALYSKHDCTIKGQLADAIYSAYDFEECRTEIYKLLQTVVDGKLRNTSLPLLVASKSTHWGLKPRILYKEINSSAEQKGAKEVNLIELVNSLLSIDGSSPDCALCGLPLANIVLIEDAGLWAFKCGHTFHGSCLNLNKVKLCPSCL